MSHHDDADQHPHTPGQDPQGSGEPREPAGPTGQDDAPPSAPVVPESQRDHSGDPADNPEHNTAPDGRKGIGGDAPLGGDQNTEDQLEADTAVEQDALKSLDPDDSPA